MTHDPDLHILECYLKATFACKPIKDALERMRSRVIPPYIKDTLINETKETRLNYITPEKLRALAVTMNDREIAAHLNMNYKSGASRVGKLRNMYGVPVCKKKNFYNRLDAAVERIEKLLENYSDVEIAKEFKCSEYTFYQWRLKRGLKRAKSEKAFNRLTLKERDHYLALQLSGDVSI